MTIEPRVARKQLHTSVLVRLECAWCGVETHNRSLLRGRCLAWPALFLALHIGPTPAPSRAGDRVRHVGDAPEADEAGRAGSDRTRVVAVDHDLHLEVPRSVVHGRA